MTIINLPISIGEGLDKLSILKIKEKYITNFDKLQHIKIEINMIEPLLISFINNKVVNNLYNDLIFVNERIWDLVDISRENGTTDPIVMKENDARFRIKNRINIFLESSIQEQKNTNNTVKIFEIYNDSELDENIKLINCDRLYYDNIIINTTIDLQEKINKIFQFNFEINIEIKS